MTTITPQTVQGLQRFLDDYLHFDPSHTYILCYTVDSRDPAALVATALRSRGASAETVPMRPLVDDEFADRLFSILPQPSEVDGHVVIVTLEKDTMSHFEPLKQARNMYGDQMCQVIRVISASDEFFTLAMNLSPSDLSRLNTTLLLKFGGRKSMHITSAGGTDLQVEVDESRFDWISNRGIWRPGGFTILPAGEIATYPASISGTLVADGAVNCNIISRLDMRLAESPITVEIEHGEAVDFRCDDHDINELVALCFRRPHGRRVGELGFGTNRGIDRFIPANSHINERRVGVHLGFGQHNQPRSQVAYVTDIHLDLITDGAVVHVDGDDPVDLRQVQPSYLAHPHEVRDEDIVEDCCGFSFGQLRDDCALPGSDDDERAAGPWGQTARLA